MGSLLRLFPLFLLIFIDAMGFAMVAPILTAHPLSDSRPVQAIIYGVAVGIYPLATFFAAPILGGLSDRNGRLPVMLFCAGGLAVSYAAIAWGLQIDSAALVILGRLAGGLTAATQAVALAALADSGAPESKDARINFGLLSSSLGFVLGPVLSGAFAGTALSRTLRETAPLLVIIVLTLVTIAWLTASYRDPAGRRAEPGMRIDILGSVRELAVVFKSPALKRLANIFLFQQFGWGAFFFFIPPYLLATFGFGAAQVSYFMAVIGIGFCVSFAVVMPLLKRWFSARAIGIGSMLVTTGCIVAAAAGYSPALEWAIAVPVATAAASGYGAVIMLFVDEASDNRGEILGVTASINALAFGVISLIGGLVAGEFAAAPIFGAAALMCISALLLIFGRRVFSATAPLCAD